MRFWRPRSRQNQLARPFRNERESVLNRRNRNHQRLTTVYYVVMVILSLPVTVNSVWMILERME